MKLRALLRLCVGVFVALAFASAAFAQTSETVYVTKTGTKYHRAGCTSLKKSSIPMPLDQAAAKYQPCKICKPPIPSAKKDAPAAAAELATAVPSSSSTPKAAPATQAVESGRCQAITKKGTQCTRKAKPGSKFCWQHGG